MNKLVLSAMGLLLSSQVFAAGVNSTEHTCASLQAAVQAAGYLNINGEFTVANRSYCAIHHSAYTRVVRTVDAASCAVGVTCVDNSNGGE